MACRSLVFIGDALTVWRPYGDICRLGIDGLEPGSKDCRSSKDDSDCQMLFLRNNHLLGAADVNRRAADFATAELRARLPRAAACFQLEEKPIARSVLIR